MVTKMQGTYLAELWRTTLLLVAGRDDSGGLRMLSCGGWSAGIFLPIGSLMPNKAHPAHA